MKKRIIRSRRARYGGMTVLLTVLLITVVVMTNVLFSTLANRYSWYADLLKAQEYTLSEDCYTLLGSALAGKEADIEIIFCDTEENLLSEVTTSYVYQNAKDLEERFAGQIKVSAHDIWLNPSSVKRFSQVKDLSTGEMVETTLSSDNVIVSHGSFYRVYDLMEFYAFAEGDTSQVWAYKGERKLASGILRALEPNGAVVGITNNHGEILSDYELLYLLDDAGYSILHFNLYSEPIPENCELIVSYNPNSDLTVADGSSDTSEVEKLNAFLAEPGHSYLVFLGNATPTLPNLESFLASWGMETMYSEQNGRSYRYTVQDAKESLTSDGCTVYGQISSGAGSELISELNGRTVFKNATALRAANGYVSNGDGSYTKGDRTMYGVFTPGESALSWANGKPVDDAATILFALTEQKTAGASSYVGVCSSVEMLSEAFLQSAVYGNTDTMLQIFETVGKNQTPMGLKIKPLASSKISTVTTAEMWKWTLILSITPAVVATVAAVVILVKRKRA